MPLLLLISVFVIATCGLIYELIAGTLASYLLGDSITQFSTIIGSYLFAMGIGSWLSRYIHRNLLSAFIQVEILVGAVGGSSAALLFLLFEHVSSFRIVLYAIVMVIGVLVGIEIPLLLRILEGKLAFRDLVSKIFTFDYIGALFASLLFPLVLVPHLGLVRSGFLFGIMNTLVALGLLYALREKQLMRLHTGSAILTLIALITGFAYSDQLVSIAEGSEFPDKIIYAKSTPYQRIIITKSPRDLRLFLNGNLQFSSQDEYRYHEALVHPAMAAFHQPRHILIFGGGDGLAVREILKYPSVETITMVDLDPAMTKLFSSNEMLRSENKNSLLSPKLTIINEDAFNWLHEQKSGKTYDVVFIDLPDPGNYSIGKLYSLSFYKLLHTILAPESMVVVQSTSPLIARKSFWCVSNTMTAAGFLTFPYHIYVPSFGEWGFVLASEQPLTLAHDYPQGLRYITPETAEEMFHFPNDMSHVDTQIQKLDDQVLVRYFDEEWAPYLSY